MDTYDRQLIPLLGHLCGGPLSKNGLKKAMGDWYSHTYLQVAINRGYVTVNGNKTVYDAPLNRYHLSKKGKQILEEMVKAQTPVFDEHILNDLQNQATLAGVDIRMTYVSRDFRWACRLTHPILDHPICVGYGLTNADAVRECYDKALRLLPGTVELIRQRMNEKLASGKF